MGNRAECPVCRSYSSTIYSVLHYEIKPCPFCECPHESIKRWNELNEDLEGLRNRKITNDLFEQVRELQTENATLKTKINKIESLFLFNDNFFETIEKFRKILTNEDDENGRD